MTTFRKEGTTEKLLSGHSDTEVSLNGSLLSGVVSPWGVMALGLCCGQTGSRSKLVFRIRGISVIESLIKPVYYTEMSCSPLFFSYSCQGRSLSAVVPLGAPRSYAVYSS